MSRRTARLLLALPAALVLAVALPRRAGAQTVPSDSIALEEKPAYRLTPFVVTAEAPRESFFDRFGRRHRITALQRENRSLALTLRRQEREIQRLEGRLHHLKTVVTDSLLRQIAAIDSATAATRRERDRLERHVRSIELSSGTFPE